MKNYSKRNFLKTISFFGVSLAGVNFPIWASNNRAYAASSFVSYNLQEKDENNLMLPEGFKSRVVAITGERPSKNSNYKWHKYPDGGAVFPTRSGGWIYVSNSEVFGYEGGVGTLVFDKNSNIINAYSICNNTTANCAGGATPWNTWLTCEEVDEGFVLECDPSGNKKPIKHKSLGMFKHESASVDPKTFNVYMTEDLEEGGFYRFIPEVKSKKKANYKKGILQVANINNNNVEWMNVPEPQANPKVKKEKETEHISALMKRGNNSKIKYSIFNKGEGSYYYQGKIFFATTGDNSIWVYSISDEKLVKFYNGDGALTKPDSITISKNGLILAADDSGDMEIVAISQNTKKIFPLLRIIGQKDSEITGLAFDPSGSRLYFSSQRGKIKVKKKARGMIYKLVRSGITYEVTGPFTKLF
jgi:hypothetical protein|tara:strand:+ start:79 stop:1326 length:1248 start_codon:yes stop_codon:yes gene_type:complete